jgi:ABC-type branched-subunit amino acid transport system substrate-binding protein
MNGRREFLRRDRWSRRDFLRTAVGGVAAVTASGTLAGRIASAAPAADVVNLGFLGDLTKAIGFFNSPRLIGLQFAYQYIWEHEGGIAGRKPVLRWYDHKSDPTEAVSGFSMLSGKTLLNSSCGTGEQQLLKPRYEAEKFITFTCSASPGVIYPLGHVFATTPYFPNQLGTFTDWLVETWDWKGKGRGPKLVSMSYPSPYGRSHLTVESKAYLKQKGVEFLGEIDIPFVIVDATAPLLRATQMGADWAYTAALFATLGPLLKENHEKGFGLKFAANSFGVDPAIVPRAGAKAAEAMHGVFGFYFMDEETDGIKLVKKTWEEKWVRPEDRSVGFVQAWMEAYMVKFAIEETLKRVGRWERITPRELIATIESWGTRDIKGLGRVTYSKDSRDAKTARIAGVRDGKWVPLTGWRPGPQLVPKEWLKPVYAWSDSELRLAMARVAQQNGEATGQLCH